MHADIVLGVVTLLMAVLGAIASLHAPEKFWWKISYIIAFLIIGTVRMVFVITQSNETSAASAGLTGALEDLKKSTSEISRMTNLNAQLQQRLLDSSKTVASLAQENINAVTGGKAYPIITPITALPVKGQNTLALQAFVVGENTLMDVQYRITEGKPPYTPTEEDLKGEMT